MSEQKHEKIEDAILELLDGEPQDNALNFAAYLNENQMAPNMSAWGKISYNGYNLGWVRVEEKNKWLFQIFNFLDFGEDVHSEEKDEEFKRVVYGHVKICGTPCHDECWRAKDVKIFGKEFKSVCSQHSLDFINPDKKTTEHIKKLIEYSKKTVPYPQQYHPNNL